MGPVTAVAVDLGDGTAVVVKTIRDGSDREQTPHERAILKLLADRDAGWDAADALENALQVAASWMPGCTCRGSGECQRCKAYESLRTYRAARTARGNTDAGKQVVGVHYNSNPEGRT